MPAIVDHDGPDGAPLALFESGAILQYLARKTRKILWDDLSRPAGGRSMVDVANGWAWSHGGAKSSLQQIRPAYGRRFNLRKRSGTPKKPPASTGCSTRSWHRVIIVAGDFFSIADMAIWPWASLWEGQKQTLEDKPHMARWLQACAARRGVTAGHGLNLDLRATPKPSDTDSLDQLFKAK